MPTLSDIASLLGVPLDGSPAASARIDGVATPAEAGPGDVSFVGSEAYLRDLAGTRAIAVIVQRRVKLPNDVAPIVMLVELFAFVWFNVRLHTLIATMSVTL